MALTSKAILQPIVIGLCFSIAQAQTQSLPSRLEVAVVQGEGAVNRIRRRADTPPGVRVEDAEHRPVTGAVVMFTLPTDGATGDFNGQKTVMLTTGADGIAMIKSMRLNAVPGKVPIHVGVSYRGLTAQTAINQVTVVPAGEKAGTEPSGGSHGHGALIAVLVCVGGAAAGGAAYLASQNKQSTPGAQTPTAGLTPIGVSAGTGSIAGGH